MGRSNTRNAAKMKDAEKLKLVTATLTKSKKKTKVLAVENEDNGERNCF